MLQGWLELTVLPGLLTASHLLKLHQTGKPAALSALLSKFLRSAGTMLLITVGILEWFLDYLGDSLTPTK